jgi:geranylgeranyl reductase family protein
MYDIIIIGAGPSGSSAARKAGGRGFKTLLIEKELFPRYKPCGGALSEQAISYLDFSLPTEIQEKDIFGARVHFRNYIREMKKNYRISTIVTRAVFDQLLLTKAQETGIEVRMGIRAISFVENSDCVEVRTERESFKSKFLIIAEGSHGDLKYRIRTRDDKNAYAVCVVTEVPADDRTIDAYIRNAIDIHFGIVEMGYGWIFPHKEYFSIGIGGLAKYLNNPKMVLNKFLLENGFKGNFKMHGHLLPVGGIQRRLAKSRIFLAGDAAGFVDSFYGEGIAYAIRSGQLATETIIRALDSEKLLNDGVRYYEMKCNNEFNINLKYSLKLAKLMHLYPSIFLRLLTRDAEVLDKFLDVPSTRVTYKDYLNWLIRHLPYGLFKAYFGRTGS